MPTPKPSSENRSRSTESFGQGQSGYAAGRIEADPALEHQSQSRNVSHADGRDAHPNELGTDERFTGGGGTVWAPAEGDETTERYERAEPAGRAAPAERDERDEREGRAKSAKGTERTPPRRHRAEALVAAAPVYRLHHLIAR
jgi:hypothetical protein